MGFEVGDVSPSLLRAFLKAVCGLWETEARAVVMNESICSSPTVEIIPGAAS
jgi:hypothetical protein